MLQIVFAFLQVFRYCYFFSITMGCFVITSYYAYYKTTIPIINSFPIVILLLSHCYSIDISLFSHCYFIDNFNSK
jgi:hypothetical protein